MTELKLAGVLACCLVLAGYFLRRQRRLHIPLMVCALLVDLTLVLYLELARGVIESLPGREWSWVLAIHIFLSVVVLVLYGVQVVTGIKKVRGGSSRTHSRVPAWFLLARFGSLITSFLVT